jgi:hypothetical protein
MAGQMRADYPARISIGWRCALELIGDVGNARLVCSTFELRGSKTVFVNANTLRPNPKPRVVDAGSAEPSAHHDDMPVEVYLGARGSRRKMPIRSLRQL